VYSCGFSAQKNLHDVYYGEPIRHKSFSDKRECNKFTKDLPEPYEVITTVIAEPVENALHNAKVLLQRIEEATRADGLYIYLTGGSNFREDIYPEYKANRPDRKPVHYAALKEYLIGQWGAITTCGNEADDAMSIGQYTAYDDTIICTIDKDLDMVPGHHYNWSSDKVYEIDSLTGKRNFYKQLLKGDNVDNIPGLYKTSGVKAFKKYLDYIDSLEDEWDMWDFVLGLYGDDKLERVILIARLLWMQEYDGQMWVPPEEESGEEEHGQIPSTREDGKQKEVQKEEQA
jgi:DNA polymerase-1